MVRGSKTGNLTSKEVASMLQEIAQRLSKQTKDLKKEIDFPQNLQSIAKKSSRIKMTAQEIVDRCCEGR